MTELETMLADALAECMNQLVTNRAHYRVTNHSNERTNMTSAAISTARKLLERVRPETRP